MALHTHTEKEIDRWPCIWKQIYAVCVCIRHDNSMYSFYAGYPWDVEWKYRTKRNSREQSREQKSQRCNGKMAIKIN